MTARICAALHITRPWRRDCASKLSPTPSTSFIAGVSRAGSTLYTPRDGIVSLAMPLTTIRDAITVAGADADDLRQNSPFAGALTEPERRRVLARGLAECSRRSSRTYFAAAAEVTGEEEFVVIGSQADIWKHQTPLSTLLVSMEVDIYPRHAPEAAIQIDGSLGDGSPFHSSFGYYAHGVGPVTAKAPLGWQTRLVRREIPRRVAAKHTAVAWCLEIHDLVLSKCAAAAHARLGVCEGSNRCGSHRHRGPIHAYRRPARRRARARSCGENAARHYRIAEDTGRTDGNLRSPRCLTREPAESDAWVDSRRAYCLSECALCWKFACAAISGVWPRKMLNGRHPTQLSYSGALSMMSPLIGRQESCVACF